jgi:hypothetical protein
LFRAKTQIFHKFFRRKYFKNYNIGPRKRSGKLVSGIYRFFGVRLKSAKKLAQRSSQPGWPDELVKNRPKRSPTLFWTKLMHNLNRGNKWLQNVCSFYIYLIKTFKINKSPIGENSPNLGSMLWSQFSAIFDNFRRKNWLYS